jgi:hypothetical protein
VDSGELGDLGEYGFRGTPLMIRLIYGKFPFSGELGELIHTSFSHTLIYVPKNASSIESKSPSSPETHFSAYLCGIIRGV